MDKLNILWTTDNKEVFLNMLSMYAINSKKEEWWKNVNLIIWGPSARLTGEDSEIQTEIFEMLNNGITIEACKDCCDNYGVTEKLEMFGIHMHYMGKPLTDYIKNNEKILTF